jgi:hypothetical protein
MPVPDVDNLPYPGLTHQKPHRPLQERPVRPRAVPRFRRHFQHPADRFLISAIVVLAT